jgi:hypothetical protein
MTAVAANYNFRVQRGSDFSRSFQKKAGGVPVDMTGLKVRAQFRTSDGRNGTTTASSLLVDLVDGDGVEITSAVNGQVTLTLSNARTTLLNPNNEDDIEVVYGIELYDDSVSPEVVTPFLQGTVSVQPEVVR